MLPRFFSHTCIHSYLSSLRVGHKRNSSCTLLITSLTKECILYLSLLNPIFLIVESFQTFTPTVYCTSLQHIIMCSVSHALEIFHINLFMCSFQSIPWCRANLITMMKIKPEMEMSCFSIISLWLLNCINKVSLDNFDVYPNKIINHNVSPISTAHCEWLTQHCGKSDFNGVVNVF